MPAVGAACRHVAQSVRELVSVLRALWFAALLELAVRLLPLPTLARLAGVRLARRDRVDTGAVSTIRLTPAEMRGVRSVRRVMRHWPWGDGPCLRRSLLIGHVLRRHGPTLRVGVARRHGRIVAHAWLELASRSEATSGGYVAFDIG